VKEYRKFEAKGEVQFEAESRRKNPRIVIGVKQTLRYARDVMQAYGAREKESASEQPSVEWMANERAKLTAGLRYLILKRDGFRCCNCGKSQSDENFIRLEVDHKVPVSEWGLTVEENLETLCRECNRGKSNIA
jgi:5-methylcytosine-specific restriction endonuclease McrA